MIINNNETLWTEKFRPSNIGDVILPKKTLDTFNSFVAKKEMPNIILAGTQGTGKTTAAKALCEELGYDWILVNASSERGIDVMRTTITSFASSRSFESDMKCIIMDEFDNATPDLQKSMRAGMEDFSKNCRFILTCNYPNKIIQPLHSRCAVIEYSIPNEEKQSLAMQTLKRLMFILDNEKVAYEKPALVELILKHFPDFRRIINECQRYASINGKIDAGIVHSSKNSNITELVAGLKKKDFKIVRKWCADNALEMDIQSLFRAMYDSMYDIVEGESIPQLVLHIANYQLKTMQSPDPELQLSAFAIECMLDLKFK
jgi:DNA polymerase III delta prime subunit